MGLVHLDVGRNFYLGRWGWRSSGFVAACGAWVWWGWRLLGNRLTRGGGAVTCPKCREAMARRVARNLELGDGDQRARGRDFDGKARNLGLVRKPGERDDELRCRLQALIGGGL